MTSPWPTVTFGGQEYWQVATLSLIAKESDPNAGVYFFVGTPDGGIGTVGPLVQGTPGKHAEIDTDINFTALEATDVTADSASWTEITPPDDDTPGVYQLNLALHKGAKGDDGDTVLDPTDYTAAATQILAVNSGATDFEAIDQKVCQVYRPTTISNTGAATANNTLATVPIDAKTYDRRLIPFAYTIVTGNTGSDVTVDLLARIGDASTGDIIGRCPGLGGAKDRLILVPALPTNEFDYELLAATNTTNVYFRVEKQGGADDYTTSSTTTRCGVLAVPV